MHIQPPGDDRPGDAVEDGRESALSSALTRLESDGAAILVGGAAPPGVARTAGRRLLGRGDGDYRRILAVEAGADVGRLLADGAGRERSHLRILRYPGETDDASGASVDPDGVDGTVPPDAGALGRAIGAAVEDFEAETSLAPGQLRVWVGPVDRLFETHDRDDVVAFVRLLSDLVRGSGGRVHFRLSARHGDRRLAILAEVCDATIRLRLRERPEMCWHVGDGAASGWVPLEWAGSDPR